MAIITITIILAHNLPSFTYCTICNKEVDDKLKRQEYGEQRETN
jgi:hypothetical protein